MGESQPASATTEKQHLGLWDAVSIIVGIVIGASIFQVPNLVFSKTDGPWMALAAWALGGVLAMVGAFCYAELSTAYPRSGGDYVYLTKAFGPFVGFLFGWSQLAANLTASIGAMAFTFAGAADRAFFVDAPKESAEFRQAFMAIGAVVVISALNILGSLFGKLVQNVLTAVKVLGLGGIVLAGFVYGSQANLTAPELSPEAAAAAAENLNFGLAMVFVLYAFGGWNDAAFVAGEVKDRRRGLPIALLLSVGLITAIYLLVNYAYVRVLGVSGVKEFDVPGRVFRVVWGDAGSVRMNILVMVSALGAVNGLIYTGARVYSSLGTEHSLFAILGRWHPKLSSPHWSLLLQLAICLGMIVSVGTGSGRGAIDSILDSVGVGAVPWGKYFGGFDTLVAATAPVFWLFFLLTGLSLILLRLKEPNVERPFRLAFPWYPILPVVFCATCVYMLYSSIDYAKWLALLFAVPTLLGIPLYFLSSYRPASADQPGSAAGKS